MPLWCCRCDDILILSIRMIMRVYSAMQRPLRAGVGVPRTCLVMTCISSVDGWNYYTLLWRTERHERTHVTSTITVKWNKKPTMCLCSFCYFIAVIMLQSCDMTGTNKSFCFGKIELRENLLLNTSTYRSPGCLSDAWKALSSCIWTEVCQLCSLAISCGLIYWLHWHSGYL